MDFDLIVQSDLRLVPAFIAINLTLFLGSCVYYFAQLLREATTPEHVRSRLSTALLLLIASLLLPLVTAAFALLTIWVPLATSFVIALLYSIALAVFTDRPDDDIRRQSEGVMWTIGWSMVFIVHVGWYVAYMSFGLLRHYGNQRWVDRLPETITLGGYVDRHAATRHQRIPLDQYPDDWDELRREIYARDGYTCRNCGADKIELHAHHIVPLSVGGSNELSNLVTLCRECHAKLHPHMRD